LLRSNEESFVIKWPDRYHPSRAPVHVVNELTIPASCEQVWAWLIRAPLWPSWYSNASDVRLVDRPQSELRLGTMFTWKTFGLRVKSTVQEFVPVERLAWSARGLGVDGYHAWLLLPRQSGTHVITEETQYGALARVQRLLLPGRMRRAHQRWLENLSVQAQSGPPH
jgi:uncharacterized protein YndB with AHSA1/START domain